MDSNELKELQAPLKQQYRDNPANAVVAMHAAGAVLPAQLACVVVTPAGQVTAGLHPAAGGTGKLACSGDMLLQALIACSGVTLVTVATAMGIELQSSQVSATAQMDFRGTLGIDKSVAVGITSVSLQFEIDSPADDLQLTKLVQLCERYCVVWQSLATSIERTSSWRRAAT